MADIVREQNQSIPNDMQTRYQDQGDGTHALVVAAELLTGSSPLSALNPARVEVVADQLPVGAATPLPVEVFESGAPLSDANPLPVTVAAGGGHNFDVRRIAVTPVITAGAYAAGDTLGSPMEFANAVRAVGGSGMITKVVIIDLADQNVPIDIVFYNQPFTLIADTAPYDPPPADLPFCLGHVDVAATDRSSFVNNSETCKTSGLRMPFEFTVEQTTLYAQLVDRGGGTWTSPADLTVILTIRRYM